MPLHQIDVAQDEFWEGIVDFLNSSSNNVQMAGSLVVAGDTNIAGKTTLSNTEYAAGASHDFTNSSLVLNTDQLQDGTSTYRLNNTSQIITGLKQLSNGIAIGTAPSLSQGELQLSNSSTFPSIKTEQQVPTSTDAIIAQQSYYAQDNNNILRLGAIANVKRKNNWSTAGSLYAPSYFTFNPQGSNAGTDYTATNAMEIHFNKTQVSTPLICTSTFAVNNGTSDVLTCDNSGNVVIAGNITVNGTDYDNTMTATGLITGQVGFAVGTTGDTGKSIKFYGSSGGTPELVNSSGDLTIKTSTVAKKVILSCNGTNVLTLGNSLGCVLTTASLTIPNGTGNTTGGIIIKGNTGDSSISTTASSNTLNIGVPASTAIVFTQNNVSKFSMGTDAQIYTTNHLNVSGNALISGSLQLTGIQIKTTSGTLTIGANDSIIVLDNSTNAMTLRFQAASTAGFTGKLFRVRIKSTQTITMDVQTNSVTVNGTTTNWTITSPTSFTFLCDGTEYYY